MTPNEVQQVGIVGAGTMGCEIGKAMRFEGKWLNITTRSGAFKEAVNAFLEKRPIDFHKDKG